MPKFIFFICEQTETYLNHTGTCLLPFSVELFQFWQCVCSNTNSVWFEKFPLHTFWCFNTPSKRYVFLIMVDQVFMSNTRYSCRVRMHISGGTNFLYYWWANVYQLYTLWYFLLNLCSSEVINLYFCPVEPVHPVLLTISPYKRRVWWQWWSALYFPCCINIF